MKTLKIISLILVSAFLLAGCKAGTSSEQTSGDTSSIVSETSNASEDTSNTESTDASQSTGSKSSVSQTVSADPGASIEVTAALRSKYFDYFAQNSTELLPRVSFDSVGDLDADDIIYYTVRNIKPVQVNEYEDLESMYNYAGKDLRAAFLKYFNRSSVDMLNSTYTFSDKTDLLYLTRQTVTLGYRFVMLISLSQNSSGIYTAKFNVYNKMLTASDNAATVTADYRKSLITGSTKYPLYGTCEMSFKEIADGSSFYIQFISSKTEISE